MKLNLPLYRDVEGITATVILAGLEVPCPRDEVFRVVKHLDEVLLMTERRDLVNHCGHEWTPRAIPLPETIYPMTARTAESSFLALYREVRGERQATF